MKIKTDFVTNSSSASFILTITTLQNLDINKFRDLFNEFILKYEREYKHSSPRNDEKTIFRFWDPKELKQIELNKFELEDFTSMYNGVDDIPHYMKFLLLTKETDNYSLECLGFGNVELKIDRDE
jgi:hypothetical protein